jgi:hypothetical protein
MIFCPGMGPLGHTWFSLFAEPNDKNFSERKPIKLEMIHHPLLPSPFPPFPLLPFSFSALPFHPFPGTRIAPSISANPVYKKI